MDCLFSESNAVKVGVLPADINAAAKTGARISMSKLDKLAIVVIHDAGADTVDITVQQHNAASGGTSKALAISNPYFTKVTAETAFTKHEVSTATETYATVTTVAGVLVLEINAEDLDRTYGAEFGWVSVNLGATTAAKVVSVLYVSHKPEYKSAYALDL